MSVVDDWSISSELSHDSVRMLVKIRGASTLAGSAAGDEQKMI